MMKELSLVLTLLGATSVLSFWAESPVHALWKIGNCNYPRLKGKFYPEKFFSGGWLVTGSLKGTGPGRWDCLKMECTNSQGKVDVHFSQESESFTGSSFTKFMPYKGILFPLTVQGMSTNLTISIVETDYTRFALVYFCEQHLVFKSEMVWILNRPSVLESKDEVSQALSDAGFKYKDMTHVTPEKCLEY